VGVIIDTSVLIEAEKGIIDNDQLYSYHEEIYISSITVSEMLIGVRRANTEGRRIKRTAFVEHIINSIPILPFQEEEARIYASLVCTLFAKNITLGVHDLLIGATAIAGGYYVLTKNPVDFNRIPGLEIISI
jgi:tRNA(fMet)-specific endonuclease VapC